MALQIANPVVVAKVEKLARATGMTRTAVVEKAIDRLAAQTQVQVGADAGRLDALLDQFDRISDRPDAFDAVPWDEQGLPS